jgi:hypothetical protein
MPKTRTLLAATCRARRSSRSSRGYCKTLAGQNGHGRRACAALRSAGHARDGWMRLPFRKGARKSLYSLNRTAPELKPAPAASSSSTRSPGPASLSRSASSSARAYPVGGGVQARLDFRIGDHALRQRGACAPHHVRKAGGRFLYRPASFGRQGRTVAAGAGVQSIGCCRCHSLAISPIAPCSRALQTYTVAAHRVFVAMKIVMI